MTDRELMQQALKALEIVTHHFTRTPSTLKDSEARGEAHAAITGLREALAEQPAQQEPVAWMFEDDEDNGHKTFRQTPPSPEAVAYLAKWNRPAWVPLYTSPPPQREWQGLTDEEYEAMAEKHVTNCYFDTLTYARAVETKLKKKNHG
jgi:hypothetical protein